MSGKHPLDGLMKWSCREAWQKSCDDALMRHVGLVCEDFEIEVADLPELIGEHWYMTLCGCAFEEVVSQTEPDGSNLAEDYLKRRGWNEPARVRAYIAALRHSAVSLYEVSGIEVGLSFMARDLIRGGDPVRVFEKSATRSLKQWDRISTRILTINGRCEMSGGVLLFDIETGDEVIRRVGDILRRPCGKTAPFALAASLFSSIWLENALSHLLKPAMPQLVNSEGDPIEFITVRYPLAPKVKQADIRAVLSHVVALRPENAKFWNWIEREPRHGGREPASEKGHTLSTTLDDGCTVLGTVELKGRELILSCNSEKRAEHGRKLVEPRLNRLVGEPVIERQSVEAARQSLHDAGDTDDALKLSPDEEAAIIHQFFAAHYRRQLDEPIPALGNISPRQAVKTAKGREDVAAWLKYLENGTAHQTDAAASFDFSWLWCELGVENLRH